MIRKLNPDDASEYKTLRLLSLKKDPESFLSSIDQENNRTDDYFISRILYSNIPPIFGYYGKFKNNNLSGYLQLSNSFLPKKKHIAYIYELYVHPDKRKKGIATELLKFAINKSKSAPELEIIELYVNSENIDSIGLYKKLGFNHIATIPNAVKEAENKYQDELIFAYNL